MQTEEFLRNVFLQVGNQFRNAIVSLKERDQAIAGVLEKCKYSIFYTNPLNTLKEGPFYFLGLNPAGGPEIDYKPETIEYFKTKGYDWCEYTKESWQHKNKSFPPGEAPHQKRVKAIVELLLDKLGFLDQKIEDIFCVNLYFFRSPDAAIFLRYGKENYDCWKYHQDFLNIVRPQIIVCNGNGDNFSSYSELKSYFNTKESQSLRLYGKFYLKSFVIQNSFWGRRKVLALGLPHLSYYEPKIADISAKLNSLIVNVTS